MKFSLNQELETFVINLNSYFNLSLLLDYITILALNAFLNSNYGIASFTSGFS